MKSRKNKGYNRLEMQPMTTSVADHRDENAELAVGAVDSANLAVIFTMFLKESTTQFLEQFGKFGMFPLAAAGAIAEAVLAIRLAHREVKQAKAEDRKINKAPIVEATLKTASAAAITTAVVFSFVAFAALAPVIFAGALAVKSLYNAGASIFYAGAAAFSRDKEEARDHRKKAIGHAVGAVACVLATAAVVGVMLLGQVAVAVAGIAAGIIGLGFAAYKVYKKVREEAAKPLPPVDSGANTQRLVNNDSDNDYQNTNTNTKAKSRSWNAIIYQRTTKTNAKESQNTKASQIKVVDEKNVVTDPVVIINSNNTSNSTIGSWLKNSVSTPRKQAQDVVHVDDNQFSSSLKLGSKED